MKYAGFSQRMLAHNIDLLPILALLYASTFFVANTGYDWLVYGIIYLGYHIVFELTGWRATPGKKWVRIHVASEKDRLRPVQIIIRNLSKILSLLLFFSGFFYIVFNERRKGLHDYLASTVVLFDEH